MKTIVQLEGKTFNQIPDPLIRNDAGVILRFEIKNLNNSQLDITGYTILFKMKEIGSTTNKINSACSIDTPLQGQCSYTFLTGDLDTAGRYEAELELNNGASVITTIKLGRTTVLEDLPA